MDPALLLLLSSLMQLHDTLAVDLASPLLAESNAPLLFFMLAASLCQAANFLSGSSDSPSSAAQGRPPDDSAIIAEPCRLLLEPPQSRETQWRSTYGLSYSLFMKLAEELHPHVPQTAIRNVNLHSALAMALCRLSQGCSSATIASQCSGIGMSVSLSAWEISRITNALTKVMATKLYRNYIRIPSGPALVQIMNGFRELTGLPSMCGAIQSSHVKLSRRKPPPQPYRSRFGFYSVLLQAVSDCRKTFWDVCVRVPGGYDDCTHFRESSLYAKLLSSQVLVDGIPLRGNSVRAYMVGDSCYPLLNFLMTPFGGSGNPAEAVFDAAIARGRVFVEQAVWLLKRRWKILQDLDVGINHAAQTIVACCVLHNLCQLHGEPEPPGYAPSRMGENREIGPKPRITDAERSCHYLGENTRRLLLEDLHDRHQRSSARGN